MLLRILSVFVIVVVAFNLGYTQQPKPSVPLTPTPPGLPTPAQNQPQVIVPALPTPVQTPSQVIIPAFPTPAPTPSVQPAKEKTLDQLLDELTTLRAQKAEMEKKEQDLIKVIQQKAVKQNERMKQLGLPPTPAGNSPDRVGRIIIEGNTVTTGGTICEMLNLQPGQVLDNTKLKEARDRLEKAGFESVLVELISSELDSTYKDIMVKVKEKKQ
jgi:hypothetical protein